MLDGILSPAAIQALAKMSYYLVDVGTIATALAFALLVAHTTMLAAGRRVVVSAGSTSAGGAASVALALPGRPGVGQFVGRLSDLGEGTAVGAVGQAFAWASLLSVGLGMFVRALIVGRGPWGSLYEFSVAFAFGITLAYLVAGRRFPIRSIALLPMGVAFFLLGYAFTLPQAISSLVPALDNPPLLTIHVAMAMLSYGIFSVSFGAAVAYLVQGKENRVAWLPPAKVLDEVAYRAVIVGFPIFATLIILGSYWASIAWGRYWGWDPKETSALVTWLIYAVYLHMRNQRGWAGRPSALILIVGFGAVLVTYLGGNLFFGGLHTYSGL